MPGAAVRRVARAAEGGAIGLTTMATARHGASVPAAAAARGAQRRGVTAETCTIAGLASRSDLPERRFRPMYELATIRPLVRKVNTAAFFRELWPYCDSPSLPETPYSLCTRPLRYARVEMCVSLMSRGSAPNSGIPVPINTGTRVIISR
jgi:hypothetical protein